MFLEAENQRVILLKIGVMMLRIQEKKYLFFYFQCHDFFWFIYFGCNVF